MLLLVAKHALTGAFGYGEDSPNQPPHHESIALARLLLEAGARPKRRPDDLQPPLPPRQ